MTTGTGTAAGVFDAGPDDEQWFRDHGYDAEEAERHLGDAPDGEGARQDWIDAAEGDVSRTAKPYRLVPADAPVRAWDPDLGAAIEKHGRDLAKAARAAATKALVAAAGLSDMTSAESDTARAENWLKDLGKLTGTRIGPKSYGRWLEAAERISLALNEWLPDDDVTEEQRAALVWLAEVKKAHEAAVEQAVQTALVEAVAEETARRTTPGAWESELEHRQQDVASDRAAGTAYMAGAMTRDMTLLGLDAPDGYQVQPPYELDANGVWMVRVLENGEAIRTRIATAPLVVTRVLTDPVGDQFVELAWRDGHRVVTGTVPRAVAKSGRTLVQRLGNAGIPIVEADARLIERYLASVEADNRHVVPRELVARQLGWQPDGEFVTSQGTPRQVEVAFKEQRSPLAAHRPQGTLAEWQTAVKTIEAYPIPQVVLSASFAAPLLEVLNLDSFTIDLSGRSTGGKSVSVMVGLSVWACPSEDGGALASWRTTLLAGEKRLNLCNGLPVVFDETRAAKVEGLVDQVLYQVPMNRGTSRGGDYPSDLPWRTVLLSTGEQPALSFTTHEGASARVLSLRGAPFGRNGDESANAAKRVRAAVAEQYGTAGPAFVARLREEIGSPGGAEKLRIRHRELVALHQDGGDVTKRRAGPVAALRLAAELAHEWNISPLPSLDAKQWTALLAVEQERDDRGAMALDVVREFVGRQGNRMWSPSAAALHGAPPLGWIGAYFDDGRRTIGLLPEVLREELARRGYQLDAVRQAWTDCKLITLDSKGNLIRRRFDAGRLRMFEFDRAVFDGPDDEKVPSAADPCPECGWGRESEGHSDSCGVAGEDA